MITLGWVNHEKLDHLCDYVAKGPGLVVTVAGWVARRSDGSCDWCLFAGSFNSTRGTSADETSAKLALETEYQKHNCPNCGLHTHFYTNHNKDARCIRCETRWPVKITNIYV